MAIITRCDGGCGAESPTASGDVANQWMKVRVKRSQDFEKALSADDRIFCITCWDRIESQFGALKTNPRR